MYEDELDLISLENLKGDQIAVFSDLKGTYSA